MITLAIETSTARGSVAVTAGSGTLFFERFAAERGHGSGLFTSLERALKAAPRCDQIAVGLGPGSYSGVRIAIAAVTGLELALSAKVVGLPSILALETSASKYLAIGDARRASFYFAVVENGGCISGPALVDEAGLREGIAAHAGLPVYSSALIEGFPGVEICFPSAERLGQLAESGRGICARHDLEPIYLRDPHITPPRS